MKDWLPSFLSDLHKVHLKKLGFKKNRHTFSRDMGIYWERFNFQGSAQNYPGVTNWRFYLNVGVEFKGLEPRRYWTLFPHTHWSKRIEYVTPNTPSQWEYNLSTNRTLLTQDLLTVIVSASQAVADDINNMRKEYLEEEAKLSEPLRS